MSTPVTLEDIYQIFQRSQEEADRRFAEADRRAAEMRAEADRRAAEIQAEADRRAAEADRRAAAADRQAAEIRAAADLRAAEADCQAAEIRAAADLRAAEADRRIAEMRAENDRRAVENEQIIKEMRQTVNSLTSRWGRFVENIVAPAVLRLFQEKGFQVQEVHQRMRSGRGSRNLEIDIFVVDNDVAIVVEVKSRLTQNEIRQVLNTLSQFKIAFPHYGNYRIYGAVAAIEIDKDVDTYAYNQGLFVIQQSGDSVMISNDDQFQPRTW
ncbi:DUF3782 domain-containing protein [Prochlorothrix hollandica]|nr:DUF3782 domain-containing protein [Prochlorothrix hollandica]